MTDWNKLKVTELKAELKSRGLPQAGIKSVLVARLSEAENGEGFESEATMQGDARKPDTSSAIANSPEAVSPTLPSDAASLLEVLTEVDKEPDLSQREIIKEEMIYTDSAVPAESLSAESIETTEVQQISQAAEATDTHKSALPSMEPQEAIEDRQKRKRRSQSPPPSTTETTFKRQRANDEIEDREDETTNTHEIALANDEGAVDREGDNIESNEADVDLTLELSNHSSEVTIEDKTMRHEPGDSMDVNISHKQEAGFSQSGDAPYKARNSRYRGLFTSGDNAQRGDAAKSNSWDSAQETGEPERSISPAIHPATTSLYIRDMQRPLSVASFKSHLSNLAAAPGQNPDSDVIRSFYLDTIRTHAYVSFTSISAASRVRSALHARIWPEERNRKPLWIDFIPEEKVDEWIRLEQEASVGGRSMANKWKVFYDIDQDRQVTAILQEAGNAPLPAQCKPSASGPQSSANQPPVGPRGGIDNAPSGPRSHVHAHYRTTSPLPVDIGGYKLSELFNATTAQPTLYWKPVSKDLANSRLDRIEDSYSREVKSGVRVQGDPHRYSFEGGDVLVDRGVELIPGLRPPRGYRAPRPGVDRGGYGGARGRGGGGGYRGSRVSGSGGGYRGPPPGADRSYDSYRGDRRVSRDYGRY